MSCAGCSFSGGTIFVVQLCIVGTLSMSSTRASSSFFDNTAVKRRSKRGICVHVSMAFHSTDRMMVDDGGVYTVRSRTNVFEGTAMNIRVNVSDCSAQSPATLTKFAVAVPMFVCIDALWLIFIPRTLAHFGYDTGYLQPFRDNVANKWGTRAATASLITIVGVALMSASVASVITSSIPAATGAVLGAIIFGVFDLCTWLSTAGWTVRKAVIDVAYGSAVWASVISVLQTFEPIDPAPC